MLNMTEFIAAYAERNDMAKTETKREVERFIDTYKALTIENGGVNLINFMKSEVVDVPEKEHRNPQTGDTVVSPAHKAVKIKIAKRFKLMEE